MNSTKVPCHLNGEDPFQITNSAIENKTGFGGSVNGSRQIVADKRAVLDFTEQVDHDDVIGLQHVNHSLVGILAKSPGLGLGFTNLGYIGAVRHELRRHGAAHELASGVKQLPIAFVLIGELSTRHHCKDFFG